MLSLAVQYPDQVVPLQGCKQIALSRSYEVFQRAMFWLAGSSSGGRRFRPSSRVLVDHLSLVSSTFLITEVHLGLCPCPVDYVIISFGVDSTEAQTYLVQEGISQYGECFFQLRESVPS